MYKIRVPERVFGVRKPRLRFRCPKPGFGLKGGEAQLRPENAGAWLPHSKMAKAQILDMSRLFSPSPAAREREPLALA